MSNEEKLGQLTSHTPLLPSRFFPGFRGRWPVNSGVTGAEGGRAASDKICLVLKPASYFLLSAHRVYGLAPHTRFGGEYQRGQGASFSGMTSDFKLKIPQGLS